MEPIFAALLLSTIAGLSTSVGSIIAFIMKKPSNKAISFIMGFSAGVMILVSFVELLQEGIRTNGMLPGMLFFLLGMGLMLLIDYTITHYYEFEDDSSSEEISNLSSRTILENNQQNKHGHNKSGKHRHRHRNRNQLSQQSQLRKTSLLVTLGVFIHNFPEGMATFIGTLKDFQLGVLITIAIALHNIPEGIAVAATVAYILKTNLDLSCGLLSLE